MKQYRIKRDVRPYGGRILEVDFEDERIVRGMVVLSWLKYATGLRTYRREELREVQL